MAHPAARFWRVWPAALLLLLATACTLSNTPEQLASTSVPTSTVPPTRTPVGTPAATLTPLPLPGGPVAPLPPQPQLPSGGVVLLPTLVRPVPTNTPAPTAITILSPAPGSVVAGGVQVFGSAAHPQFLQYQVEYGPDPNPGNLWYPVGAPSQGQVIGGLLATWNTNTTASPDGVYQLRLRVYLRDGSSLTTLVNNIRVQNRQPTPIPTATSVPRPIAAFSQSRASGNAPLVVEFFNQSAGQISNYSWNFGDGGSSDQPNPTHTFRTPGVYNVVLQVTGPGGTSNVARQVNVQGAAQPVADFRAEPSTGIAPLVVQFTSTSSGEITRHDWIFGDGFTSTERNPQHTFRTTGTFNVILQVTGPGGSSFVTRQIVVQDPAVPPPTAAFSASVDRDNPSNVVFVNRSAGNVSSLLWEFGDGTTSNEPNPQHTYTAPGDYPVRLTVAGRGGQATTSQTVRIVRPPDAPNITALTANPATGDVPLTVRFDTTSAGEVTSRRWDFGDGTTSTEANPTKTYTREGTFVVVLRVDGPGGFDVATTEVTALRPIQPPTAGFIATSLGGTTVQFTNQSQGEQIALTWTFGDGTTSTEVNPVHTFPGFGAYTVTLTARNPAGENSVVNTVDLNAPPTATFTAAPPSATPTATATDFPTATDAPTFTPEPTPTDAPTFTPDPTVTPLPTATEAPTFTPEPSATATPAFAPVQASFTATVLGGTSVQFDSQATTGDVLSTAWDFGDGLGQSGDRNPLYTYAAPGTYTVTLTVFGQGGDASTVQQTITLEAPTPEPTPTDAPTFTPEPTVTPLPTATEAPTFTPEPTATAAPAFAPVQASFTATVLGGTSVQFDSQATTGDVLSTAWDFGDGLGQSGDRNPLYTYAAPGTYTVTLTVFGQGGDASTVQQTVTLEAPTPQPTTTTEPVVEPPVGNVPPVPAPANTIAFTSDRDGRPGIYTISVDGGAVLRLSDGSANDSRPSWSPDRSELVFVSDRDGTRSLYIMRADGTNVRLLTSTTGQDDQPSWSPDGSRIVFSSERGGSRDIYVISVDGNGLTQLTFEIGIDDQPSWSPDGSRIAFSSDRNGNRDVYVMNADGTSVTALTDTPGADEMPTWLGGSAASRIVFVSDRDGGRNLYLTSSIGLETAFALTSGTDNNQRPNAPARETRVVFVSDRDGNDELYVLEVTSLAVTRLTDHNGTDTDPVWAPN